MSGLNLTEKSRKNVKKLKLCFESTPNGLRCRIGMLILFWINKVFAATDAVSQGQEKERREVDSLNI